MPDAWALAIAVAAALPTAARKCNGAREFCSMTLDKFMFAGTHNAGSYGLSPPTALGAGAIGRKVRDCIYENHDHDFVGQLAMGIRYFSVDLCDKDGDPEPYLCHGPSNDDSMSAFGPKFKDELSKVRTWMWANPTEIVVMAPENLRMQNAHTRFRNAIEDIFGVCWDDYANSSALQLNCTKFLWHPSNPSLPTLHPLTLDWLIDNGRRLIASSSRLANNWGSANQGQNAANLFGAISDWSRKKMPAGGKPYEGSLWEWAVFFTQSVPQRSEVDSLSSLTKHLRCNKDFATEVNPYFFPGDDADPKYKPFVDASRECDGTCGCLGYRSPLEPLHQWVLDQGHSVMSIIADYVDHGHIAATVQRMNMATWRRTQGLPEPGIPWHSCTWGIAAIVGSGVALVLCLALVLWLIGPRLRNKLFCGLCSCCQKRVRKPKKKKMLASPYAVQGNGCTAPANTFGAPDFGMAPGGAGAVPGPWHTGMPPGGTGVLQGHQNLGMVLGVFPGQPGFGMAPGATAVVPGGRPLAHLAPATPVQWQVPQQQQQSSYWPAAMQNQMGQRPTWRQMGPLPWRQTE